MVFIIKKIIITFLIVCILTGVINKSSEQVIIPKEAIRFRVIANSDSEMDQSIKLQVRDNLQKQMIKTLQNSNNIEESRRLLKNNIPLFEKNVNDTLKSLNSNQTIKINYGQNYFPKKEYKGLTYEEGNYESLVVTLGKGKGKNWWCVLFPPLCLLEAEETDTKDDVEYKFFVKELIDKYFN